MDKVGAAENESESDFAHYDLATPARQDRSRKSLDRIITAAEVVLRRDGIDGFSIAAIAEGSGLSVGGIYARVNGKQDLFLLLKDAATLRLAERIESGLNRPADSLDQVVERFVDALISGFSREEKLMRALFTPGINLPEMVRLGTARRRRGVEQLVEAVVRVRPELARVARDELLFGGDVVISYILGVVTQSTVSPEWRRIEGMLRRACTAYFESLSAHAPGT